MEINLITIYRHIYEIIGSLWMIGLFKIDSLHEYSFFPGSLNFSRVLETQLFDKTQESLKKKWAQRLHQWAKVKARKNGLSNHWWLADLPSEHREAFEDCASDVKIFRMFSTIFKETDYDIIRIPEMDELYITGTKSDTNVNSDQVFFTTHLDGPFGWVPYMSVYRCLIALNENSCILTHFPMNQHTVQLEYGDVLGFDFNREIHYIESIAITNQTERLVAKCHYCIYPKGFHWMGQCMATFNARYNQLFRNLFLHTIKPKTLCEKINSRIVLAATTFYVWSDIVIGHNNILFVGTVYLFYYQYFLNICITIQLYKTALFIYQNAFCRKNENIHFIRDIWLYGLLGILA